MNTKPLDIAGFLGHFVKFYTVFQKWIIHDLDAYFWTMITCLKTKTHLLKVSKSTFLFYCQESFGDTVWDEF